MPSEEYFIKIMGQENPTQDQQRYTNINSIVNIALLLLVASYFIYVSLGFKFRVNWQSRIRMVMIAVAFTARASLSLYDCFISYQLLESQKWRFYITYYVDVVFMMIYLTAIFRVVGSWTIFEEIQTQVKPSLQQIFSDGRNDFIRRRV